METKKKFCHTFGIRPNVTYDVEISYYGLSHENKITIKDLTRDDLINLYECQKNEMPFDTGYGVVLHKFHKYKVVNIESMYDQVFIANIPDLIALLNKHFPERHNRDSAFWISGVTRKEVITDILMKCIEHEHALYEDIQNLF